MLKPFDMQHCQCVELVQAQHLSCFFKYEHDEIFMFTEGMSWLLFNNYSSSLNGLLTERP